MSGLASILTVPPTESGWQEWTWAHYQHHRAIIDAATQTYKGTLILYQIFPFNKDAPDDWLLQHQQMHSDMNSLYGINGSDLSSLDFQKKSDVDAWLYLQWQEHEQVSKASGVSI